MLHKVYHYGMKEIKLNRTKDYQVGNVRVSKEIFEKITALAKENKVTNQTIVRAIVENFIDEIKIV